MRELTTSEIKVNPSNIFYQLEFNEGLAPYHDNGLWGYIDTLGRVMIPAQYVEIGPFSEGLAPIVKKNGANMEIGFINKKNDLVIDFLFDKASWELPSFKNDIAIAYKNKRAYYINKDGDIIQDLFSFYPYKSFSAQGIARAVRNRKQCIIDIHGNILDRNDWLNTDNYDSKTKIYLSRNSFIARFWYSFNKFDLINKKVTDPLLHFEGSSKQFDLAFPFKDGIATAMKWGANESIFIFDSTGKRIGKKTEWSNCGAYNDELIRVSNHKNYKDVVNYYNPLKDTYLFPSHLSDKGSYYRDFKSQMARITNNFGKDGNVGYINKIGDEIIERIYERGTDFKENIACVQLKNQFIYLDKNGAEVFKFK